VVGDVTTGVVTPTCTPVLTVGEVLTGVLLPLVGVEPKMAPTVLPTRPRTPPRRLLLPVNTLLLLDVLQDSAPKESRPLLQLVAVADALALVFDVLMPSERPVAEAGEPIAAVESAAATA
jgi:hypothetical protein